MRWWIWPRVGGAGAKDIREVIYERLVTDASITALVGSRIRPLQRHQADTLPAITYQVTNHSRPHYLNNGAASSVSAVSLTIECWSHRLSDALAVKQAVIDSLDGWWGVHGGRDLVWCEHTEEGDEAALIAEEEDESVYWVELTFELRYR